MGGRTRLQLQLGQIEQCVEALIMNFCSRMTAGINQETWGTHRPHEGKQIAPAGPRRHRKIVLVSMTERPTDGSPHRTLCRQPPVPAQSLSGRLSEQLDPEET